ncbi:MAG: DUF3536 domain-containing protein [Nitrospiraceae bacterium]|nr:MAG: DUF3536 domain-containing protein [Nitrospiraceae bacterium]
MDRYICIHGHFYQPPRENPWLEEVELQDSAYPFHDWNERITAECYAPNGASRILDADGRIIDIVNNYSKISFNFGPTLLSWMERHRPDAYEAILEADRLSLERFSGHGSAIAQAYNHMIMPLANRKDKQTQILWGIEDFRKRFRRAPEGMWLAETAVDMETLDILKTTGIVYTILAPRQAKRMRRIGKGSRWQDAGDGRIDPTTPYRCRLPSGKSIVIFFYDGPISQDIAFSGLLYNGEDFARRLMGAFTDTRNWPQIVHIATDGETYGHHHRGGDMALAYCLHSIESNQSIRLTNYGEYLELHPPGFEVEIHENSSWSCIHGIERWRENCGCSSGMNPGWNQMWRRPLREALDMLRDTIAPLYEAEAGHYLKDPWTARDDYISVILDRSTESVDAFLRRNSTGNLQGSDRVKVIKLLEMQRNTMLMYTSCGWFFDELSGIETVQVMQYASIVIQLASDVLGTNLEEDFITRLASAPSNLYVNGAKPYEMFVKPARLDLMRVGAHYSISSVFEEYPEEIKIYCYTATAEEHSIKEAGKQKLATGRTRIVSDITGEEKTLSFAVLHLGDHTITAGVKDVDGREDMKEVHDKISDAFGKGEIADVIRLIDGFAGGNIFSIRHLFRDEQRKVTNELLQATYEGINEAYRRIFEDNYAVMNFFQSISVPVPKSFRVAAEHVVNSGLRKLLDEDLDIEKLQALITEIKKWSLVIDKQGIGFAASRIINSHMETLQDAPENLSLMARIDTILKLLSPLSVDLDLWKAQNIYFSMARSLYKDMKKKAEQSDGRNKKWIEEFRKLGYHLKVKVV